MLADYIVRGRMSLPLESKIIWARRRIRNWYEHWHGQVSVSLSGIDSRVLLHICRSLYPGRDIPAVCSNTGLEFPEIISFNKTLENVTFVRPRKSFKKVIAEDGYPVVSKRVSRYVWDLRRPEESNPNTKNLRLTGFNRAGKFCPTMKLSKKWLPLVKAPFLISDKCCQIIKKEPLKRYAKESGNHPMLGILIEESNDRQRVYKQRGCNAFTANDPVSWPLAIWTKEDIWAYVKEHDLDYSPIYDMGYTRTGCVFCMFGVHLEKEPNRFQLLKKTHPKLWKYCIEKLKLGEVLDYISVPYT